MTSATTSATPTLHLIDASPYIFRAYFSLPSSITSPQGEPVNAVYGFASFLIKLIGDDQPTHLALGFDGSLTTSFRNELFPEYKAQREKPPAELKAQLEDCRRLAQAFGCLTFIDDRYEADDIVGALWKQHRGRGGSAVVVTSDKDLSQLVDEATELWDFAKDDRWGVDRVREKFGVGPEQIPDYLGLAGDSVDNIPGVTGIGAKTAAALLSEMASLEEIYEDLGRVAELPLRGAKSVARKLEQQKEQALLSKKLATVAVDAPFTAELDELEHRGAEPEQVDELFERLGFQRIRERIPRWR